MDKQIYNKYVEIEIQIQNEVRVPIWFETYERIHFIIQNQACIQIGKHIDE